MPTGFLGEIIFIIAAAFAGGFVARSLKLPPILGYIASGLLFGYFGKSFFHSSESLTELAQIGISLLLFTLGFEISFESIKKLKDKILLIGFIQVLITSATLFPLLVFFHFSPTVAVLFAFLLSFSSTAVVVKLLEEKGFLNNFPGDNVFLLLLIQDLLVVPAIFFLPFLFSGEAFSNASLVNFLLFAVKPILIFGSILILSRLFLTKILNILFRYPTHELTILASIFIASVSIGLFTSIGLPQSLAAFLAGMLIAEQGKNLTPLSEIRPFRDILLVLFFVMTGILVDVNFLFSNLPAILIISLSVVVVKFLVFYIVLRFFKYSPQSSIFISSYLSNVGEFALVIGQIALFNHYISNSDYNTLLCIFIFSLLLVPVWVTYIRMIGDNLARIGLLKSFAPGFYHSFADEEIRDHVVICGHGRVGKQIRSLLDIANIPYVVVDFNRKVISELSKTHKFVIYGDPTDEEILKSALVATAKTLVIAVPDSFSQKKIIKQALLINPEISILCRSHIEEDRYDLLNMGASSVIVPELEAGLRMGTELFELFGVPDDEAQIHLRKVRRSHSS